MNRWVFLNGEFLKEPDARLHFRDLSIQRGYGIFDFFKVRNFSPVFLDEHLDRFYFSAREMHLDAGHSKEALKKIIFELIQKNGIPETGIRLTLTGGYSEDGYQLTSPNLIISSHSFQGVTRDQFETGIRLITYPHQRQLPQVKTIDYLMAIWLQPHVKQKGAHDVLYHHNGLVLECPRANFFLVTADYRLVTPDKNILGGITRQKILLLARERFTVEERDVSIEEIKAAREIFISSTSKTILPVAQVDDYAPPHTRTVAGTLYQLLEQLGS
jgi:D-alanine transaminase/branched-chain amino acid aminotransferase